MVQFKSVYAKPVSKTGRLKLAAIFDRIGLETFCLCHSYYFITVPYLENEVPPDSGLFLNFESPPDTTNFRQLVKLSCAPIISTSLCHANMPGCALIRFICSKVNGGRGSLEKPLIMCSWNLLILWSRFWT